MNYMFSFNDVPIATMKWRYICIKVSHGFEVTWVTQAPPPPKFFNHSTQSSTQILKGKVHNLEVKLRLEAEYWLEESWWWLSQVTYCNWSSSVDVCHDLTILYFFTKLFLKTTGPIKYHFCYESSLNLARGI